VRGTTPELFNKRTSNAPPKEGTDETEEELMPIGAGVSVRRFQRGLIMEYGFVVYNAQLDSNGKPQVKTQVRLFRDGQQIFAGEEKLLDPSEQKDLKRLGVGGAMQLGAEMEPGEYVLQVIATDSLAEEKHRIATQWIDFEILK
jgi:hypothetical protein